MLIVITSYSIHYTKLYDGAYLAIFGAVITIVLNVVLVPLCGYVGSAWATLVCYFSMMVLSFYWGQKYYKVPYDLKNAGFYFLLALIVITSYSIHYTKLYEN